MLKNAGRSVMAAKACQLTTKPTRRLTGYVKAVEAAVNAG
jgi:hypothetical protein